MKSRVNRRSTWTMLVRALSFSAVTALTLNSALAPVVASDYAATPMVGGGQIKARFLALGVGKREWSPLILINGPV